MPSGKRVRGSASGRPIMSLLDLLGRRWTLRVLWELRDGEPLSFRELRARCEAMSPSVLNARLRELREAGIVELTDEGFALSRHGAKLQDPLLSLDAWAKRWMGTMPR